mmetsp:Transcript_45296/g.124657  ORF Transcript_45296/g.124657 Transcript_45296/m.124657 type:complete len:497 (-) Transcript_45296:533-2023(-)
MQLEGMDAYPFPELGEIGDPSQSMFSAMNEPASAGHSEAESTQPAKGLPGAQAQPQLHTQAQTQQRVSYARPRRGRGGRGSGRGRGGHRRSRSDHAVPWGQSQGSSGDDFESSRNAGQLERESVPSFGPGIRGTPQAQVAASASASAAAPMTMSTAVAAAGAGGGGIGASLMIASSSANPSGSGVRGNFGGVNPRSAGTRVVAEASGGGVSIGRMVGRTDAGDGGDGGASPASRVGRVTVGATPHQKLPPKPGSRHGRKTKAARGHRRTQSEPIDMLMDDDLIDMGEEDQDPFVPINNCSSSEWATLIAEEPGEAQMMSPQSLVNAKTGSFAIGSFDRSELGSSSMMDASMDPTRAAAAGRALVKGAKARHGVATGLRVPMVTGVAALAGKRSVSEFAGPRGGQLGSGESKEGGPEDKAEQMIQSKSDGTDADDEEQRGKYRCGRCGKFKVNHVCTFVVDTACRNISIQVLRQDKCRTCIVCTAASTDALARFSTS